MEDPLLSPRTHHVSTHVALSLCISVITAVLFDSTPMVYDGFAFMHCSAVSASLHCIVANTGRATRVFKQQKKAIMYYCIMCLAHVSWIQIDHYIPHDCFIMLSSDGFNDLSTTGWALAMLCAGMTAISLRDVVVNCKREKDWEPLAWLFVGVAITVISACLAKSHNKFLHVHHYMWASVFALLARYNTPTSIVTQAVCLGIFNQQIAGAGLHPFFDHG